MQRALLAAMVAGAGMSLGCSASVSTAAGPDADGVTRRDTTVVHEECDLKQKGAHHVDVNNDGRPDITIVRNGATEVCRAVDLNFDGKIDAWVYRDPQGKMRRRESDYDRDGRIDEIAIYQAGSLVEKHRATTLGGKLDTWHFYKAGALFRTERDSDGDAIVDQWWEYPTASKPECPLIHSDVDGDGRPDPGATVDVCSEPGSGYVPPERSGPGKAGPSFEPSSPGDVPVELDQKDAPPASEGGGDPGEGEPGAGGAGEKETPK